MSPASPLVCSRCAAGHEQPERFCRACGMPLVYADGEDGRGRSRSRSREVTERQARARKVKRQYSEGPLVRVASARHQAEAELISGLLLEEGVASVVRRSGGFDVPDFLAAGPRDILVAESGAEVAREVLRAPAPADDAPPPAPREGTPLWVQAFAVTMIAMVIAATAAGVALAVFG